MGHQVPVPHRAATISTNQYPRRRTTCSAPRSAPDGARNLTCKWVSLAERQGVRKVPLHGLRHACVSLLLAQCVHPRTVMEIVRHSAIDMTMNVNGHVNLET